MDGLCTVSFLKGFRSVLGGSVILVAPFSVLEVVLWVHFLHKHQLKIGRLHLD